MPQFRELGHRVRAALPGSDPLRQLHSSDLTALGYDEAQANGIFRLLDREDQLTAYLHKAEDMGIYPLTRLSDGYPRGLNAALGYAAPPVLFYRGNVSLLSQPSVAVVGSRQLHKENEAFARDTGRYLALTGRTLVSGGAMGADRMAQTACLDHGGTAVIFIADRLTDHAPIENTLFLSADGFDVPFSIPRALGRNKLIHIHGQKALAVQCAHGVGGTWQGCMENLKHRWSPLYVFDDGSQGAAALTEHGAKPISRPAQIEEAV